MNSRLTFGGLALKGSDRQRFARIHIVRKRQGLGADLSKAFVHYKQPYGFSVFFSYSTLLFMFNICSILFEEDIEAFIDEKSIEVFFYKLIYDYEISAFYFGSHTKLAEKIFDILSVIKKDVYSKFYLVFCPCERKEWVGKRFDMIALACEDKSEKVRDEFIRNESNLKIINRVENHKLVFEVRTRGAKMILR